MSSNHAGYMFILALLSGCLLCFTAAAAVSQLDGLNESPGFPREQRAKEESPGDYQTREILQYLSHLMKAGPQSREPYWLVTLKRGLDLGLGRGFSGSQAAKHLMGKAVADFAYGPGRKRR